MVYGPTGELRCTVDAAIDVWSVELDRANCRTRPNPIPPPKGDYISAKTPGGDVVVADGETVRLHDPATGALKAESEPLGDYVSSVAAAAGSIWAMVGADVVKLDAGSLAVAHRTGPSPDLGNPELLGDGDSVWVVDDYAGILAEVDPATGAYAATWWLPDDGASDREVYGRVVGDGIWFVDVEQTGEPYRFDFVERRFERLPISSEDAAVIFAMDLDVIAGPPRPQTGNAGGDPRN